MSYPPSGYLPPDGFGQQPGYQPPQQSGWPGFGDTSSQQSGWPGFGGTPPQQAGWPGYGGPPVQFGGGGPGFPGGPGGNNNRKLALIAAASVAVIALMAGALFWGLNRGPTDQTAQSTVTSASRPTVSSRPTATPAPTTAAPTQQTTAPAACEGIDRQPGPQTPAGWQTVVAPRHLAYDVPQGWNILSCTSMVGWEKPCPDGPFGSCPVRTMSGPAELPNATCPKGSRGVTGVPGAKGITDINQAVQAESRSVKDIYTSKNGRVPTVSLSPPRSLTVDGTPAVQIVATVTNIESDDCTGPSALHSMVATTVPGQPGTVLFVISLEQGYPGAPDPGLIDQMVSTLRRV